MRIVLLSDRIPPDHLGGAEKAAWTLALGLKNSGHDVHIITATTEKSSQVVRDGISIYYLHAGYPLRFQAWLSLYNPQVLRHVRDILEKIKPYVVHAHNVHRDLSYASLRIASKLGIPVVLTAHDLMAVAYTKITYTVRAERCGVSSVEDYRLPPFHNLKQMRLRYNPARNLIIRHILRHHTNVRTCCSEAQRQALEVNGLPPFRVVANGVDPAQLYASPDMIEAVRTKLELHGRKIILFGGRITAEKGLFALLKALDLAVKHVPEALLLILTKNELNPYMFGEYRHLLDKHVCAGGWMEGETLAAAYRAADVITQPSLSLEPAGLITLEAMAASKPVIVTCHGGTSEYIIDGETGYSVNPLNSEIFADRLERLLMDSDLNARMGAAGERYLRENFTLDIHVNRMVQIYRDLIG